MWHVYPHRKGREALPQPKAKLSAPIHRDGIDPLSNAVVCAGESADMPPNGGAEGALPRAEG